MFSSLKFKLTLLNIAIIAVILFLISAGIYFLMQKDLHMQSEQMMRVVATQVGSNAPASVTEHGRHPYNYFYAKTDSYGNITAISSNLPIPYQGLNDLIHAALVHPSDHGIVQSRHEHFQFFKTSTKNPGENVLVFTNDRFEDECKLLKTS